ncbi:hypothetical protein ACFW1A_01150 [Kitasatospora sp. NPDC058965]|uniref:hypothetical protein n=1 Tax=Kitasatospora sp. NPDC058965 TaxID=3346682 RepID=UPI0036A71FA8
MRRALSALAAAALAAAGLVAAAPMASASGYGCSGNLIGSFSDIERNSGATWGTLYVYYDSSTGDNCAVNVANSAGYYGTLTYKDVTLKECAETSPSVSCHPTSTVADPTTPYTRYYDYAGPVRLHAPGHCIYADGTLSNPANNYLAVAVVNPQATFCG